MSLQKAHHSAKGRMLSRCLKRRSACTTSGPKSQMVLDAVACRRFLHLGVLSMVPFSGLSYFTWEAAPVDRQAETNRRATTA